MNKKATIIIIAILGLILQGCSKEENSEKELSNDKVISQEAYDITEIPEISTTPEMNSDGDSSQYVSNTPSPTPPPPGTLPEPEEIPKQTKYTSGEEITIKLINSGASAYEYYYNNETNEERLIIYRNTGSERYSELFVTKVSVGGIDNLCDLAETGESVNATIVKAVNISFEEGTVYAYNAIRVLEESEPYLDITSSIVNSNTIERYLIMTSGKEEDCKQVIDGSGSISVFGNTDKNVSELLQNSYDVYEIIYERFNIAIWE